MTEIATTSDAPAQICGYTIDSALSDDKTYLAIGPGGRGIGRGAETWHESPSATARTESPDSTPPGWRRE